MARARPVQQQGKGTDQNQVTSAGDRYHENKVSGMKILFLSVERIKNQKPLLQRRLFVRFYIVF